MSTCLPACLPALQELSFERLADTCQILLFRSGGAVVLYRPRQCLGCFLATATSCP
jgi:hypothetical protein